jgi:hypothetical protein
VPAEILKDLERIVVPWMLIMNALELETCRNSRAGPAVAFET